MMKYAIPILKLKLLKSELITKRSKFGMVTCSLSDPKPVLEEETLGILKKSPKLILYGIIPSSNLMIDRISMNEQLMKISNQIPETKKPLTVKGFNIENNKKIILLEFSPKVNLRKEYFQNIEKNFSEELIMQMIKKECTMASFEFLKK